jgi:hypothetical protein
MFCGIFASKMADEIRDLEQFYRILHDFAASFVAG